MDSRLCMGIAAFAAAVVGCSDPGSIATPNDVQVPTPDTTVDSGVPSVDQPVAVEPLGIELTFPDPTLSGLVQVKPTITGGARIIGVEFLVDGVRLDTDLIAPFDYMLNSAQFPDGDHTVGVFVADDAGQSANAELEILFDNTPPDIDQVFPNDGDSVFFEDGPLAMRMAVEDVGPLKQVTFRVNGLKVAEFSEPPFEASVDWDDVFVSVETLPKTIFVQYVAEDNLGLQTEISGDATVYSRRMWTFETVGEIWGAAVTLPSGDFVFGNHNSRVLAVSPSGEELWSRDIGGNVTQGPVYDAATDRVFVGGGDGVLYAISSDGASVPWTLSFGSPLGGRVRVVGSTLYAPVFGGSLRAVDASSGSQLWQFNFPAQVFSTPAVAADGTVYVGCKDKFIYAIKDGAAVWSVETGGEVLGWPVLGADGTVYVGSNDGRLYAIAQDGTTTWQADVQGQLWGAPLIGDDGDLYVISTSKFVTKVATASGGIVWTTKTEGLTYGGPVQDANGTIYVGTSGGKVFALDPETGAISWSLALSDASINGSPIVSGDTLIAPSTDRNLYAVRLASPD